MANNIGKNHPEYADAVKVARKMRVLDKGTRKVKECGEEFLCRDRRFGVDKEGDIRFEHFLKRAQLIEAIRPTRRLITSRIFENEPSYEVPERIISAFGGEREFKKALIDCARWVTTELIIAGRSGVAIEAINNEGQTDLSFFKYPSESIANWRKKGDSESELSMFVAAQEEKKNKDDRFCHETVNRRLVEYLDDDGKRVSEVWISSRDSNEKEKTDITGQKNENWTIVADSVSAPRILGDRVGFLPFHIFTTEDTIDCSSPILESMGETVLSAFETSAWHRNHLSLYGTPTPYIAQDPIVAENSNLVECVMCKEQCTSQQWDECGGCKSCESRNCKSCDDGDVKLGGDHILMLAGANAKAGFMEPRGTGSEHLHKELTRQQEQIVSQGAKMFRQLSNRSNKTATAENYEEKHDTDSINDLSNAVDRGMLDLLQKAGTWLNLSDSEIEGITFRLSRSYKSKKIEWKEIAGVIDSWTGGNIPLSIVLQILKEAGYISSDLTEDEYLQKISEFEFEAPEEIL